MTDCVTHFRNIHNIWQWLFLLTSLRYRSCYLKLNSVCVCVCVCAYVCVCCFRLVELFNMGSVVRTGHRQCVYMCNEPGCLGLLLQGICEIKLYERDRTRLCLLWLWNVWYPLTHAGNSCSNSDFCHLMAWDFIIKCTIPVHSQPVSTLLHHMDMRRCHVDSSVVLKLSLEVLCHFILHSCLLFHSI